MLERFTPGTEAWFASDSPSSPVSVVFEDDGESGYFYAHDRERTSILDAIQIYTASRFADRNHESTAHIVWSPDGQKAGLFINERLHAVVDFSTRCAYGRSNFPPPSGEWSAPNRLPWRDDLDALLR
jgi:hypothetical protein